MSNENEITIDELDADFSSDAELDEKGAWMEIPGKVGMKIRLRPQNSTIVRNMATKISRRHRALYAAGRQPTAEQNDADECELLARAQVTGWEGFGPKESPIACNEANVTAIMKKYPQLRNICSKWSNEYENYRKATTEAMSGNSEPSSTPN
jgi:hypothetical protein